ncbi:anti-sigma-F factor Fin family protein [Aquibacillus salsiterrae]|uniref:Anti-sigma-F factor Fin family protein n=1 Tax=Aquibacillus salsiterrae TaxID=2950439 RepID=A0A9X3WIZ4_9BACI|nr:anti-sigma-F factor Fin family protein [Aquibacillus salsiterrae]MDC3417931.1 anti-sigma-F factor Fin family protein [Aquibacillus salsiterrae]
MAIVYTCNHCNNVVGKLDQEIVDTQSLGWNELSAEDRNALIEYQANGDVKIKTICEDCQESLEKNPAYHELDNFIQ